MDRTSCSAVSKHTLHCALELSKKSWLLASCRRRTATPRCGYLRSLP
jgi:hypothetical protein